MEGKKVHMALLYDFYGDLLTEKQRRLFDLYHNDDLSLSEIAELEGISRQGVRDVLVRAEAQLTETEEKTGIIRRYMEQQGDIAAIENLAREILALNDTRFKNGRLTELANSILERLQFMKD